MKNLYNKLGAGFALVSLLSLGASPAFAQMVPVRSDAVVQPAPAAAPIGNDVVMLSEFVRPCRDANSGTCDMPRPANANRGIDESNPVISHAAFVRDYPQMGEQGYQVIRSANRRLCDQGNEMMAEIQELDRLFQNSDLSYQDLQAIYNALPRDIKRSASIQLISQVGATGALCALSAGLYCIAAAVGGVGNIFGSQTNKNLQLANIKLSIANIVATRLNIRSNRLTLRMDAFWLDLVVPYCMRIFPGTQSSLAGSYSGSMAPLPPLYGVRN